MADNYTYEDLKAFIDAQCKVIVNSNAPESKNKTEIESKTEAETETNFEKYKDVLEKQGKKGEFNLFKTIYPKWRHENFHSQMLKFLLENYPTFFDDFLILIGVAKENYTFYSVQCEYSCEWDGKLGRIDLAIFSGKEKHVIIIENKLNWASDQESQLDRYNEGLKKKGYVVDKIVYLSPSKNKKPPTFATGEGNTKPIHLLGFDASDNDLVSCLDKIKLENLTEDYRVFLKHYIEILKQTGEGDMSVIAEEFLEEIKKSADKDIGEKLAYMKKMLDNMSEARGKYWMDDFVGCAKNPAWATYPMVWKEYSINDVTYYIDVLISDLAITKVIISNRHKNSAEKKKYHEEIKKNLDNKKVEGLEKVQNKDAWYKDFNFPKEDDAALEFVKKVDAILTNL